jgi:hypothetical protein
MVAAATAEPEITTLTAVFSTPAAWSTRGWRASLGHAGNMLEHTFGGARPAPSASMPLQVPAGQAAADEGPAGLELGDWLALGIGARGTWVALTAVSGRVTHGCRMLTLKRGIGVRPR